MSSQKRNPGHQITFLRHAESVGNAEFLHQGQADFPLTPTGREQAQTLARYWHKKERSFDKIISSPLSRAKETALILNETLDLPLDFDPLWMERDNGKLAGLSHDEARETLPQPDFVHLYQPIAETGESLWELYLRACQALNQLIKRESGSYLVVSHGAFLNMVIHAAVGLSPQPNFQGAYFILDNTALSELEYYPPQGLWVVRGHNLKPHLSSHE
jgi:2,3-bisphosphoglycerate-dependent phosphoglycerate mutase